MIFEHDRIVLTTDAREAGLVAGDVGTVVHVHRNGEAYEVEFSTLTGETVSVLTLEASKVRPVGKLEVAHAREVSVKAA